MIVPVLIGRDASDIAALMPHSPYFGPGFLATLHLTAAEPNPDLIEWLYLDREACLYGDVISPKNGKFAVPECRVLVLILTRMSLKIIA